MNHEQQIEDLQRELIRVERDNRILREANAVAGEQLRQLQYPEISVAILCFIMTMIGFVVGITGRGCYPWS